VDRSFLQSCLIAVAALLIWGSPSCRAEDSTSRSFEIYSGVDYDSRAASLSSTLVWSYPNPIDQPGFRMRADGLADVYGNTNASVFSNNFLAASLKGVGDVMAGVQFNLGTVWIKLYGGAAYEAQTRIFWQVGQVTQVQTWGGAAAAEGYLRLSDRIWTSAAISWVQPDSSASLYSRVAYEIYKDGKLKISTGVEAGFTLGNADLYKEGLRLNQYNEYMRGGALLNVRYGVHDFSLSGGLSQASDETFARPYATIRYGRQF
jgi:hypothetical protein